MTALYARMADLCQCVFTPGNPDMLTTPACLPYLVEPAGGSLKAHYTCPDCRRRWVCWWSRDHLDEPVPGEAA